MMRNIFAALQVRESCNVARHRRNIRFGGLRQGEASNYGTRRTRGAGEIFEGHAAMLRNCVNDKYVRCSRCVPENETDI